MFILVTYDVNTEDRDGRRRLRRVVRTCQNFGQRVQLSVVECVLAQKDFIQLKADLLKEIDTSKDSLRIYFLNGSERDKILHFGTKQPRDLEGTLIL